MKSKKKDHFKELEKRERNDKLEHSDDKYGKTEHGNKFFWGVRSDKLHQIDRTTRRTI